MIFDNIPVRAVWNEETSKWWFCAVDIAEALTGKIDDREIFMKGIDYSYYYEEE